MAVRRIREREVTFSVGPTWTVPDLSSMGLHPDPTTTDELIATYHDTDDGALRRLGVTLRHRTGGSDAGWHLKVPAGVARTEVRSQASGGTVPHSLSRRVGGVVGARELRPVAMITTIRRTTSLRDDSGSVVAEIADDTVSSATLGATSVLDGWREVEVELGPSGTEQHLLMIIRLLRRSGASIADEQTKLSRVLPIGIGPLPDDEVARTVVAYVREQCCAILIGDIALRDRPDSSTVHRTRVAIRRLRSALRTMGPLFDDAAGGVELDEDLRWLAALLAPIRDGDVISRRLLADVAALPSHLVLGPVVREITETAAIDRRAAIDALRVGRDEVRYARTLDTVAAWHAAVPVGAVTLDADTIVDAARKQLRRRLKKAHDDADRLHRARKAAKRLRYTAEALSPLVPRAAKIAKSAKRVQAVLGEHQDLAVAAAHLRRLATEHGASASRNGFTYGVLHANAEHDAAELRAELQR